MSQLETVMLILLGFAVASLLALIFGRLAWNFAYRLGVRRTRRLVPNDLVGLRAERDRLRAELAIVTARAEAGEEDLRTRFITLQAELMRNRNRIGTLGEQLLDRDRVLLEREAELAAMREQLRIVEAELAQRTATLAHVEAKTERIGIPPVMQPPASAQPQPTLGLPPLQSQVMKSDTQPPQEPHILAPEPSPSQDRLAQRIADLARITEQIKSQQPEAVPLRRPPPEIRSSPFSSLPPLPPSFMEPNLSRPDSPPETNGSMEDAPPAVLAEPIQREEIIESITVPAEAMTGNARISPSVANVISLAQRLRQLKRDINS
jgi:hypothetical protein